MQTAKWLSHCAGKHAQRKIVSPLPTWDHTNLKGESVVVAILPPCMEASIVPPDFFVVKSAKWFCSVWVAFPVWTQITHTYWHRAVNHSVTIMCADCTKSEGTITHLHTWWAIWPPPHSLNTGVKKRPDFPFQILRPHPLCTDLDTSFCELHTFFINPLHGKLLFLLEAAHLSHLFVQFVHRDLWLHADT